MKFFRVLLIAGLWMFTSSLKAGTTEELKSRIIEIAKQYTSQTLKAGEAREKLQPLVDELIASVPSRSEEEKLDQVIGGWKNLWSYRSFGFNTNYNQVYQIVSEEGYYYNLSQLKFGRAKFAGFLRGQYSDAGDKLRIKFTSNKIKFGFYKAGTDLMELAESFEAGEIRALNVPGPIGIQGDLINAYVDDTLRIVTGKSDGDLTEDLFILTRTETISE